MTDDLDMGAIVNTYGRGPDVKLAIEAGNDLAMICHQVDTAPTALEHLKQLSTGIVDDSLRRIEKLKKRLINPFIFTMEKWQSLDEETMQLRIDVLGEELAKQTQDYSDEKRSPVEGY